MPRAFYRMEQVSAGLLHALNETYDVTPAKLTQAIARIQKEEDMELDEWQAEAVRQAATHGLFILTGTGNGKDDDDPSHDLLFRGRGL